MSWLLKILLNNPIVRAIGAGLTFVVSLYLYGVFKVQQGKTEAKEELIHEDVENAIRIRKQADKDTADVKAHVDTLSATRVDGELRKLGKLRD